MPEAHSVAGLGSEEASIRVFMANRPDYPLTGPAGQLLPANGTLIENINRECGNGWRKVFNVYAKWVFALSKNKKKSNLKICLPFTVDLRGEHLAKRPHLPIVLSNPPMFQWLS